MVTANARKLASESLPEVRIKEIRKVVINRKKVRRLLWIGGLIILLTMVNAIIQAFLAQQQFHLEEIQSELKKIDSRIGWLQCELADRISLQSIEKLALYSQDQLTNDGHTDEQGFSQILLSPNPALPPSILNLEDYSQGGNMVAKISDWLSGLGRTLAGGDCIN